MNLNPAQWARTIVYLGGFALGAFAFANGIMNGDAANITTGLGLLGVSGLAVPNVPGVRGGNE